MFSRFQSFVLFWALIQHHDILDLNRYALENWINFDSKGKAVKLWRFHITLNIHCFYITIFIFNQFSVSIFCGVMFIIMVLDAQILVSWLPMGSTHIGKQIFQKVNKIFVKINLLVFMEDIQLILKTIISI